MVNRAPSSPKCDTFWAVQLCTHGRRGSLNNHQSGSEKRIGEHWNLSKKRGVATGRCAPLLSPYLVGTRPRVAGCVGYRKVDDPSQVYGPGAALPVEAEKLPKGVLPRLRRQRRHRAHGRRHLPHLPHLAARSPLTWKLISVLRIRQVLPGSWPQVTGGLSFRRWRLRQRGERLHCVRISAGRLRLSEKFHGPRPRVSCRCSKGGSFRSKQSWKTLLSAEHLNQRGGWIKAAEYASEQATE